jgi:myo-inositol-1(or 4)-monophosphatase
MTDPPMTANPPERRQQPRLWTDLADLAAGLALEAGKVIIEMRDDARATASTKSSVTDLVTAADREAEALIASGILGHRPDDSIQGEEGAHTIGSSPVIWHIDPIDGTTNYVYGIPAFSVSNAAEIDGVVVAGAVLDPSTAQLYRAVRNGGAFRNDVALSGSEVDDLAVALVATGFSYAAERRRRQAEVLLHLLPHIRDLRRFGSAALDLCLVASGQVDAYFEQGLNSWDLAAGSLVASEAGAVVENLRGGQPDSTFVLAAGSRIFSPLRELLVDLDADTGP